jgi:hypothetical protein
MLRFRRPAGPIYNHALEREFPNQDIYDRSLDPYLVLVKD